MDFIFRLIKIVLTIIRSTIEYYLYPGPPFKSWNLPLYLIFRVSMARSIDPTISLEIRRSRLKLLDFEPPDGLIYLKSYIPQKSVIRARGILNEYFQEQFPLAKEDRLMDVEWIKNMKTKDQNVIMHYHGGGFFSGTPIASRNITTTISLGTDSDVICPSYSLAPDHPFPNALIDCLATYLYFSEELGYEKILLSGDSAGGYFCIAIINLLKFKSLKPPCGVLLFSPCLDLKFDSRSFRNNGKYDILPYPNLHGQEFIDAKTDLISIICDPQYVEAIKERGNFYCGSKYMEDNLIALFQQTDYDYPPMLIQSGEIERLVDDSIDFANKLYDYYRENKRHNYLRVELYKEMPHAFVALAFIPQSKLALKRASSFITCCFQSSLFFVKKNPYIFVSELDGTFTPFEKS